MSLVCCDTHNKLRKPQVDSLVTETLFHSDAVVNQASVQVDIFIVLHMYLINAVMHCILHDILHQIWMVDCGRVTKTSLSLTH